MSILRNMFLNTAAVVLDPRDPVNDGTSQQQDAGDDTNSANDTGTEGREDAGAAGDGTGDDGEPGDADPDGSDDDDGNEDDELAGFTPEQREKIEARIARETTWRDRQLARLNAKKRSAEEDVRAARTIAEGGAAAPENLTEAEINKRAEVRASQMSAQERYDNDANAAFAKGSEVYDKKWKTALDRLPNLGGVDLSDMQNILATDKPHVVLFALSDPETYERVMALPVAKRHTEFIKLSLRDEPKAAKTAKESKRPGDAPPPVRPLSNGRKVAAQAVDLADDKVSDEAWYAERNRTRRKKFSDHV